MVTPIPDASATLTVAHPPARVWKALTTPAEISRYFLGTEVVTDWNVGSPITFRGEWQGKSYEDHGRILEFNSPRQLRITHFSPLTGLPDTPENYHTLTYTLAPVPNGTTVTITQGNNRSESEIAESENTWRMILDNLDQFLAHRD
ncbi:SRPBCC domain-containing protein [Nocardia tengchongensis]|uniref:SRPBCC family protein n=1 Tax=Nocardia tengchongensis TaxID=2055889 RepID=UPI0033CB1E89